jgi:putative hemolysin
MEAKKAFLAFAILAVSAVLLSGCISGNGNSNPGGIACTADAKLCPDGSAVGRTGPDCEFAPCPHLVGNDSDIHGCKGSAGYSWCEEKQKCIRAWEENCSSSISCTCPQGYVQEGDACNPKCYYSTPKCLMPSIRCSKQGSTGMANPAAVNCIDKGYNYSIRADENGGQYGVCYKENYTECEEWAFFRGECEITPANGSNVTTTGIPPRSEGQFCGGIAGIPCQQGLACKLGATYPDAGGSCVKECDCSLMTNGTEISCFGCAHDNEKGSFNCRNATSGWTPYVRNPKEIGIPYACYCDNTGCALAQ